MSLSGAERSRRYRERHPERTRARWARYYADNRDALLARNAEYMRTHQDERWAYNLRRNHGMTPDEWWAMYAAQGGCCAICGKPATRLEVDHDHASGVRRGLLCVHCNRMLGHAFDDTTTLRAAIAYLARAR